MDLNQTKPKPRPETEDLYRLQGEARAFRRLKLLRDEVNGPKPD